MNKVIPLVSIIIPIYNASLWLRQCLASIAAQNFDDYEIICVNDGSTDDTPAILQAVAKKDPRITVISQANAGPGAARNRGISEAKGKYISFVDADDFIEPDFLKTLVAAAEETGAALISFNSDNVNDNCVTHEIVYFDLPDKTRGTAELLGAKIFGAPFHSTHFLYQTDFLKENNLFFTTQSIYCEDVPFVLSALLNAQEICFLRRTLYHYRQNSQSIVHTRDNRKIKLLDVFRDVEHIITASPLKPVLEPCFKDWKITMLSSLNFQLDLYHKKLLNDYVAKNLSKDMLQKFYRNIRRDNICLIHCFWLPLLSVEKNRNSYLVRLFGKLFIGTLKITNTLKALKIYWWNIPILYIKKMR